MIIFGLGSWQQPSSLLQHCLMSVLDWKLGFMTEAKQEINIRSNFAISVFLSSGILMLIFQQIFTYEEMIWSLSTKLLLDSVLTANIKSSLRFLSPSFWIFLNSSEIDTHINLSYSSSKMKFLLDFFLP